MNEKSILTPKLITDHINGLLNTKEVLPHNEILQHMVESVEPVNFKALVYPNIAKQQNVNTDSDEAEKFREKNVRVKQYRILTINQINRLAEKNDWKLCKKHGAVYLFNGMFWKVLDEEVFQKFLGEVSERMSVKWDLAQDYRFREDLFKQFLATANVPIPKNRKDTVLINLQNGTFEITPKGMNLRSFNAEDFLTYQLPFQYDSTAEAPLFMKFLGKVLPEIECQRILSEYLGSIFMKNGSGFLKEEKALILYGSGANGKSVIFEIMNALLGRENVTNYSLDSLTDSAGYYRASIAGKLLNYASEMRGKKHETDMFKQMASGEPIPARFPHEKPQIIDQYAKMIFNCNELPKDVEHTDGYFRRLLVIPFEVTIPEEEQDKELHLKIIEKELPGVFNWILDGLKRLVEQKRFTDSQTVREIIKNYRMESDSVLLFLEEFGYAKSLTKEVVLKAIFNDYQSFCIENGFYPCGRTTFSDRLSNAGFQKQRKSGGYVVFAELKK